MKKIMYLILIAFIGFCLLGIYYFLYWYNNCHIPMAYTIGTIDTRFKISSNDVKTVAQEASTNWNTQTNENLFIFDPNAKLKINLVYDSRQEEIDKMNIQIDDLNKTKSSISDYQTQFNQMLSSYQSDLATYNNEVNYWNSRGGAPEEAFNRLQEKQKALDAQRQLIIKTSKTLNIQVQSYNDDLTNLKSEAEKRQNLIITQGQYDPGPDTINIYTFGNKNELRLVLMHELGHTLGLDHAQNETSIMYALLDKQEVKNPKLTQEDISMIKRECNFNYKSIKIYDKIFSLLMLNPKPVYYSE